MKEFERIQKLLAPLTAREEGARNLHDDAATLDVPVGFELVITKDALVEGIHFIGDEPPHMLAKKLLRVNLSDLAAMGAAPRAYLLALMLPKHLTDEWLESFCNGLRHDQEKYDITLIGGDCTSTSGPMSFSLTAIGQTESGTHLTREGANIGDHIYVSGTIGDATLGLACLNNTLSLDKKMESHLMSRYHLPIPRLKLGQKLKSIASSCIDISDGLAQDLEHITKLVNRGAQIDVKTLPLSPATNAALQHGATIEDILSGGDDYELLFTVPKENLDHIHQASKHTKTPVTAIGIVTDGTKTTFINGETGKEVILKNKGYDHFT